MQNSEATYFKQVAVQLTSIILAAVGAALIAYAQSMGATLPACETPATDPQQAGLLGALFKGIHSAFWVSRGTMHA